METHRAYDSADRLTRIYATNSAGLINSFAYTLDSTGRRIRRDESDSSYLSYSYDSYDQLISASRTNSPNPASDAAYKFAYQYDLVGNRLHEDRGLLDLDGTFNPLNQLTALKFGGKLDIVGQVSGTNGPFSVKIDGKPATVFGANPASFHGGGRVKPGTNTISIVSMDSSTNRNEAQRHVTFPPTNPQSFQYDANGNLTSDGMRNYTWDAENRLIQIETVGADSLSVRKRSEYQYDAQSRMYERKDYSGYTNGTYSITNITRYVWDGYNIIREIIERREAGLARHSISGKLSINPNNDPQAGFELKLPDGTTITRAGLTKDFPGYAGPAAAIRLQPSGSGKQTGLLVDGEAYPLDNSNVYSIVSGNMSVKLYNDKLDKKNKPIGKWLLDVAAGGATIQVGNLPAPPAGPSVTTNSYIWGLDLSQSLQGAGGVGGLLCVIRNGTPYFPCYDGNGNITDYINTNGVVVAHREYDPFGKTVSATGPMKDNFLFWFSTKPFDPLWEIVHYPYRPYSPSLHIWLSRDPIGDIGSVVNIVPLPKSRTITEDEMAVSRQLEEIVKKLEAYASSAGITFAYQELIELRIRIAEELQKEQDLKSVSTDNMPKSPKSHLYSFVENDPISNIDPYGLWCIRTSRHCAVCVWPDCPQPPYRPCPPGHPEPPPSPTGIICFRCEW